MNKNSDIKLYNYVDNQIPKLKTIQTSDLESMFENFSPEKIVETSNLSSDEVIDSFRLSLITESLTEQYAETYKIGADMHDAQWLNNFVMYLLN